jgi:hypothetical protein
MEDLAMSGAVPVGEVEEGLPPRGVTRFLNLVLIFLEKLGLRASSDSPLPTAVKSRAKTGTLVDMVRGQS